MNKTCVSVTQCGTLWVTEVRVDRSATCTYKFVHRRFILEIMSMGHEHIYEYFKIILSIHFIKDERHIVKNFLKYIFKTKYKRFTFAFTQAVVS